MIKDIKLAILAVVFVLIIFPLGLYNLLKGDREYSELENRKLQERPKLRFTDAWSGEYFKDYESYIKDQFAFKDEITSSYVQFNFYGLKRDKVNGFYLGKDGRIYEDKDINLNETLEKVKKRNEYIKKISKEVTSKGKEFYAIYVPTSSDYSAEGLPIYAKANMKKVLKIEEEINSLSKSVDYVNLRDVFEKDAAGDESTVNKFYFKTDNHWNINGAWKAYEYIVNKARKKFPVMEPPLRENEEFMVDTYFKFNGSYNRQLQFNVDSKDELKVFRPRKDLFKERITNYKQGEYPINKDLVESNYSYSVFMGGDMARDVIKTNRRGVPSVLLVGNSFTNPLETLLYTSFNEMHSMDIREENMGEYDVAHYANQHGIDVVVYLIGGV